MRATLFSLLPPLLFLTNSAFAQQGKELAGERAAAATVCPSPEEARAKMSVPEGYEVRCFAHEPMVQNPVAMTWDHRGRLWVVEAYEYPEGSPHPAPFGGEAKDDSYHPMPPLADKLPRDRVIILEDTDNDGEADKRTVFVEGLNLASAILCGDNGIYVGQQPHLLHFSDDNGDDKPDQWRVCLTGFGREDTHELINSLCWGPDGWMYMTHGVFTNSKVRRPGDPVEKGFKFDAGIGRARAVSREKDSPWKFEVFADGTSNPWGCDYDAAGNFFVSACVIDHFFHMAPGGIYVRQGGAPENPYAYELIPSIVKHKHFRAAYAGVQMYQGGRYPKDTWGHAFIGNIHDNAIHEEVVTPAGSTFKCEPRRDFLRANDGWFRPVSTQTGPDGFLWVMDWCDKYPCYQNAKANPEGVDRDRGRIWRVVSTSTPNNKGSREKAELNLEGLSTADLVQTLEHPNNWMRRAARRQLVERQDANGMQLLETLLKSDEATPARLEALWALGQFPGDSRSATAQDLAAAEKLPVFRAWAARFAGEQAATMAFKEGMNIGVPAFFERLAADKNPAVRMAMAVALRQFSARHLTVDGRGQDAFRLAWPATLESLLKASAGAQDPRLALAIWQSFEPMLASNPTFWSNWLAETAPETQPLSRVLAFKTMRRLCDTRSPKNLNLAIAFCDKISEQDTLLAHALNGLVTGQESGIIKPVQDTSAQFTAWRGSKNEDVKKWARQLAVLWGDPAAIGQVVETLLDEKQPEAARIAALQSLRKVKTAAAESGYAKLLENKMPPALLLEAMRGAVDLGGDSFAATVTSLWQSLQPGQRIAAAESLASRPVWASALLEAVSTNTIARGDLPMTVARSLVNHPDKKIQARAAEVIGVWKESSADTKALIEAKKKACLTGKPDLANGKLMFTATCMVCHEFHGGGQKVGPDLIGSGRSNLDAILANVIDPNQIIGNGYENFTVATKDGRTFAGRVVEDTPGHVKLLGAGGAAQIVPRDQVATLTNTKQSLMPMGFGNLPDDAFRDLIWYILAPPEEGPLTKEKKDLLVKGVEGAAPPPAKPKGTNWRAIDWESISLWNPAWKVNAPDFERTPVKLADYYGKSNVLLLHPFPDKSTPAVIEQKLKVGPGKTKLAFRVAADDRGDWEMRIVINGKEVKKLLVDHEKPRWKEVELDLTPWNGLDTTIRLESHATGWAMEFAYWHGIEVK